jgi:hypothetical protein
MASWVTARLDRADAIYLDATVQLIADKLAANGDQTNQNQRRARALGILANPAAAIQLTTVHTNRDMNPIPASDTDQQTFVETAARLIPAFTPRTQVYVHMYADTLTDPDAVARVETIGALLNDQIAEITRGSRVKVTPVVHVDGVGITVDSYEIPHTIREQVLLRLSHDVFPWSSIEARKLDLDHTKRYQAGGLGQTRPANLGPLSRRSHRVKTFAGWTLEQPSPGVFIWRSGSGQTIQVDQSGSHRIPNLE